MEVRHERVTKPDGSGGRVRSCACARCGCTILLRREDDPLFPMFRSWTLDEQRIIADTYRKDYDECRCPVDASSLRAVRTPFEPKVTTLLCGRCGQSTDVPDVA